MAKLRAGWEDRVVPSLRVLIGLSRLRGSPALRAVERLLRRGKENTDLDVLSETPARKRDFVDPPNTGRVLSKPRGQDTLADSLYSLVKRKSLRGGQFSCQVQRRKVPATPGFVAFDCIWSHPLCVGSTRSVTYPRHRIGPILGLVLSYDGRRSETRSQEYPFSHLQKQQL